MEGKQTKERLKEFNPLLTLRYSATHKDAYNMVYRLDAMEAYNKRLVKKIAVKGITETGSTATDSYLYLESINLSKGNPTATLQFEVKMASGAPKKKSRIVTEGDNLYDYSNGLEEYKNGFVVSHIDGRDDSVEFINGIKIYAGDVVGAVDEDQLRRIQIRETILSHLQRERQLFYKGIKVLSLFFIDEVANYREYDAANQPVNGKYAVMFEEEYEDILNNYDSMAEVIMAELDSYKKEFGRKRRTVVENAEEAVFEEKKVEEQEVVFLMDRFGYAKTVDMAVYERNKEAADSENKYIVHCMNTGKLCIFTDTGKMHQVKVLDLPYGKFREKGTPIDNVSNYTSSEEEIVMICDAEQMRFAKLLFATAQGMIKRVDGKEFQVAKRTIVATKLQEDDRLVSVKVVNETQNLVLQTRNGYFLRFPAADVPEKKKAAVGVRGIRLQKKDELEHTYLFEEGTETKVTYGEKTVTLNRLKAAKRDGVGNKTR